MPWVPHPSPWSPHPSPWAPQPSPGPLPFAPWKPGDAFSTEEEPWAPFPPASGPWHIGDQIRYTELLLPFSQQALAHRGSDRVHRALPSLQSAGPGTSGIRPGTKRSSFPPASGPWHTGDQIRYTGLFLTSSQRALAYRDQIRYTGLFLSLQSAGPGTSGIRPGIKRSSFPPSSKPWRTGDQIMYTWLFIPSSQWGPWHIGDQIRYTNPLP